MASRFAVLGSLYRGILLIAITVYGQQSKAEEIARTEARSPDGRNSIALQAADEDGMRLQFAISRDGRQMFGPSPLGPVLSNGGALAERARITDVEPGSVDESFPLAWGKTAKVANRYQYAVVTLASESNLRWQVELRAF